MASLERTSATLDQLISENRHSLDGGIQGLAELGPAVSELRDTLAALRGISRRLEENPANYLLGRENQGVHPMRLALRPLRRLSLAALATLGACSILPEAQVLQVYLLPVHNPPASAARPVDWSLRIARPRTSLVLESPRIAVRPHGDEISVPGRALERSGTVAAA